MAGMRNEAAQVVFPMSFSNFLRDKSGFFKESPEHFSVDPENQPFFLASIVKYRGVYGTVARTLSLLAPRSLQMGVLERITVSIDAILGTLK